MRGDAISRAEAARRVLDDPASKEALGHIREDLVVGLERIPLTSEDNRDAALEIVRQLQTLATLKAKLVATQGRGKLEEKRLADAENRPQRANDPRWIKQ